MENEKPKSSRAKARERWAAHIENWQASGLTQVDYCRRENIDANSFSNWKRKLRETPEGEGESPFVELPPAKAATNGTELGPLFEFSIGPEGVSFRLNLNAAGKWRPGA
ncbi:MAG: transposase [Leptospirales bacterium]|jgi:hypothetical protein